VRDYKIVKQCNTFYLSSFKISFTLSKVKEASSDWAFLLTRNLGHYVSDIVFKSYKNAVYIKAIFPMCGNWSGDQNSVLVIERMPSMYFAVVLNLSLNYTVGHHLPLKHLRNDHLGEHWLLLAGNEEMFQANIHQNASIKVNAILGLRNQVDRYLI
jgi:hypothetical protein